MGRFKVITCFIPSGRGLELLERLRAEKGIASAYAHHARGVLFHGASERRRSRLADETEILTVLAPEASAEELFDFLFEAAAIGTGPGMLLMERALSARPLRLPEG